jgi:hypothetical protein
VWARFWRAAFLGWGDGYLHAVEALKKATASEGGRYKERVAGRTEVRHLQKTAAQGRYKDQRQRNGSEDPPLQIAATDRHCKT